MTTVATAIAPTTKKRNEILKRMSPATREVAEQIKLRFDKNAAATVQRDYDVGAMLGPVAEKEAEHGPNGVQLIAEYLNIAGGVGYLGRLRDFALSFKRDYVTAETLIPMDDGGHLTTTHWCSLMRLGSNKAREQMLKMTRTKSLSTRELDAEIAASGLERKNFRVSTGRPPAVPTSAVAGLKTVTSLAQKMSNLEQTLLTAVFDKIDEMPPDRIDESLLVNLNDAKAKITKLSETGRTLMGRINNGISRVKKVLAGKPKGDAGDGAAGDGAAGDGTDDAADDSAAEAAEAAEDAAQEQAAKAAKPVLKKKKKKKPALATA